MKTLTPKDIENMPYVDLLAMMGESNLPPGGFQGIRNLIDFNYIHSDSKVLHVGSSSGFLSREICRLTGCNIVGVDINGNMTRSAQKRVEDEGLSDRCKYINADICQYKTDDKYDVALTGGALAFILNQQKAVISMRDCVKPYGFVTICELFYHKEPPPGLRKKVSEIIGVDVPRYRVEHWDKLMDIADLVIWGRNCKAVRLPSSYEVGKYCTKMAEWVGNDWNSDSKEALKKRIFDYITIFTENMSYLSSVTISCRRIPQNSEPLLFI